MNNEPDNSLSVNEHIHNSNSRREKISFKEQWNKVDELCDKCGKVSKPAVGINRQNIKRLLSFKMGLNEIVIFLLLIMLLFSVYRYYNDTNTCRSFIDSGSKVEWDKFIKSGISIESVIAASQGKGGLNPLLLNGGLTNVSNSTLKEAS